MKKYFDVRCPYCFEQMRYNDAVFRRKNGEEGEDEYLKNYYEHFGNKWVQDMRYGFVDPADPQYSGYKREIKDGFLEGIENPDKTANDFLEQRLCPFCHNELFSGFGRIPARYIAVIGVPGSGKTTYLASLNEMMRRRTSPFFLWRNYNQELEELTKAYVKGFRDGGVSTKDVQGPYFCTLTTENTTKTDIVFLDIPGECYIDERRLTPRIVNYVKYADGLIFIVDASETVENVSVNSIDVVLNIFHKIGLSKKPTAIMLNKIDLAIRTGLLNDYALNDYQPPETKNAIDVIKVESVSNKVKDKMLNPGGDGADIQLTLRNSVMGIMEEFGDECYVFATRLIREADGIQFLSLDEGADTPFLWLLAKMGAFPVKQEKKKQ